MGQAIKGGIAEDANRAALNTLIGPEKSSPIHPSERVLLVEGTLMLLHGASIADSPKN